MDNECVVLVDNTNLFIGGQQLSARRRGMHARHNGHEIPDDPTWRLDFAGLLDCLAEGRKVQAAVMVGSSEEARDCPWDDAAREAGFEVVIHDTNARHAEKAVDTELVARGVELVCTLPRPMTLVLASGDRDYVPLVRAAHRHGWKVELCAFRSSFSAEGELAHVVDRVRPLDAELDRIGNCE